MNVWMRPLGAIQTNAYVLSNEKGEGIIIDPGLQPEKLLEHVQEMSIQAILLTHAHFDHIGGLEQVRQQTKAPVYIHDLEAEWICLPDYNGSLFWTGVTEPIRCKPRDYGLEDGQQLQFANITIDVLHTPGHSPGSVSFYIKEENLLIAGDTLFDGSIGRTDLPGGDYDTLINSIQQKFMPLPDETKVCPGHGMYTTIGQERKYNPFLTGR